MCDDWQDIILGGLISAIGFESLVGSTPGKTEKCCQACGKVWQEAHQARQLLHCILLQTCQFKYFDKIIWTLFLLKLEIFRIFL